MQLSRRPAIHPAVLSVTRDAIETRSEMPKTTMINAVKMCKRPVSSVGICTIASTCTILGHRGFVKCLYVRLNCGFMGIVK